MNKKIKYLTSALIALTILIGSASHASAYEKTDTQSGVSVFGEVDATVFDTGTDYSAQSSDTSADVYYNSQDTSSDTGADPVTEESADADSHGDESETLGEGNFFESVYNEIIGYASEILCALTLVGSLTLAVAYKKGLLPLLEKSLVSIGNAITKIKESTKESAEKSDVLSKSIDEKLTLTQETVESLGESVASLAKAISETKRDEMTDRMEKRQLRLVIDAQIDMLYDIFMSSALPQYQKDAVGERIAAMKEAMKENGREK